MPILEFDLFLHIFKCYSFALDVIPEKYVEGLKKEWNEVFLPEDCEDSDLFHSLNNELSSLIIAT